jgi:hypothetical protein
LVISRRAGARAIAPSGPNPLPMYSLNIMNN